MDFDAIADRLYGLPPTRFTEARNAAVDRARAVPDLALAERVRMLRRPTLSAWLANLLVREHPQETRALLDLGAGLRTAQDALDGPGLRELTVRRRAVVAALSRQAAAAATAAGRPVGESALLDLEEHLLAVLADPELAEAFATGRLTTTQGPAARTPATRTPAAAARTAGLPVRSPPADAAADAAADADAERSAARRLAVEARREAKQAQAAADAARRALERASAEHVRLQRRTEELEQRLDRARDLERKAAAAEREARTAVEDTDRVARKAQGRARDADAHQQHLADRAA